MCLAQGPQRSDAGETRTRYPSVSSQALYHWATALPGFEWVNTKDTDETVRIADWTVPLKYLYATKSVCS